MSSRHVHSKDPRKPVIVRLLCEETGASRVTEVREILPGVFAGTCHANRQGNGKYTNLGRFTVDVEFNGQNVITAGTPRPAPEGTP